MRSGVVHLIAAAATLAVLVAASEAGAAVGDLTYGSCASDSGTGGFCTNLPGDPLTNPNGISVSPDSASVYAVGVSADSVAHFVTSGTTSLAFSGCDSLDGSGGECTDLGGTSFSAPERTAVTPDGTSLYVTSRSPAGAVAHFSAGGNGVLTSADCVSSNGSGPCSSVDGLIPDPIGIAVSPNGKSVYVTSWTTNTLVHFAVESSGELTFADCVSNNGSGGFCTDLPGSAFNAPNDIAVGPSGAVFVGVQISDAVASFTTNAAGALTYAGCASDDGSGGTCTNIPGGSFDTPNAVAVSPDGLSLYAVLSSTQGLARFSTGAGAGLAYTGCTSETGSGGDCTDSVALATPNGVAVSPDGRSVYVSSAGSSSVDQFDGTSTAAPAPQRCYSDSGTGNACVDVTGTPFGITTDVAVSPDGRSVYATSRLGNGIVRLGRETPPIVASDTVPPHPKLAAPKSGAKAGKAIKVTVSCDEACTADVSGTAKPKGGKAGKLKGRSVSVPAAGQVAIKLKPAGKLKKLLKKAGKGKATIKAVATDAAGNSSTTTLRVKLS